MLDITAAPGSNPLDLAYNSGAFTTAQSFAQQYGYFEVQAQLPAGQGFWPSFWLLPTDGSWPPEIDIFEVLGNDPTTAYFSLQPRRAPTTNAKVSLLPDLSTGFHTYGLDWQADRIRWYVDGNEVAEAATPADMQKPMYMLLNLAVGDTGSWPGKYDPSLPTAHMLVDYVRVWQTGTAPPPPAFSLVTGPADVAAVGGTYTLKPDGLSDLYDFSKARAGVHFDGTNLPSQARPYRLGQPLRRRGPGRRRHAELRRRRGRRRASSSAAAPPASRAAPATIPSSSPRARSAPATRSSTSISTRRTEGSTTP